MSKFAGIAFAVGALTAVSVQAQEVNIYNSRHYNTDRAIYENFTKKTGIKVNIIEGNHDELIQRLKSEGGSSPADLFITVDAGRLAAAAKEGLLLPVTSPELEAVKVPANLRDPGGAWWGLSTRARIIVYARDRVKPDEIKTYEDLAKPEWHGRVLTRSGTHPYSLALTASMIEADGEEKTEEWVKGLVANLARPPQGGDTDQIRAVAVGEGDVALANTYYVGKFITSAKQEDREVAKKIGVIFPNQADRGTHVNLSGAGVVKTSKNAENARKLLEYLLSPDAQRMFADGNMEYPVNPAVQPHPELVALGSFRHADVNAAAFAAYTPQALRIMDRAGWK
ncbi:Fe(3+) ABC transporter substrate-binding protein [Azospirillum picis]|uniref:Iron(III) transport system substrate-binding protein n=1 Tax=Azospirillum picis TaxID=488438 RepID=A0ABU0MUW7_9PROT|nr:Fe(3+) ABC transporter substrate-binding protein [Azospirillum picis]MBP2303114.1 iron(III) transport system substrate-binding protein [Azospirillum picis]MDQ0536866.1 iron(III) transport system substrate-binding protein [Azospirillum picis]